MSTTIEVMIPQGIRREVLVGPEQRYRDDEWLAHEIRLAVEQWEIVEQMERDKPEAERNLGTPVLMLKFWRGNLAVVEDRLAGYKPKGA